MLKVIISFFLLVNILILSADSFDNITPIKPHYQIYKDSVWYPNTTACDFISAYKYNNSIYFALTGGVGKFYSQRDSLIVYPYPFYSFLKGSIRSVIKIDQKLWIAFQTDGIRTFDLENNSFTKKISIKKRIQFQNSLCEYKNGI